MHHVTEHGVMMDRFNIAHTHRRAARGAWLALGVLEPLALDLAVDSVLVLVQCAMWLGCWVSVVGRLLVRNWLLSNDIPLAQSQALMLLSGLSSASGRKISKGRAHSPSKTPHHGSFGRF
eukprot:GHVR01125632.1.p1 GENE.GHVR01125632.1~~GHVR01125632.1.p1  ORF type:complete len:120 (+),score=18.36 GHVR01125632.1:39-398(+)